MTYQEAVAKMEAMPELGYRTVEFETRFHAEGGTVRNCHIYSEKHGGFIIDANTWDAVFVLLAEKLRAYEVVSAPVSEDQAPMGEHEPTPKEDTDVPF